MYKRQEVTIPAKHPWSDLRPCNGSGGLDGGLGAVSGLRGLEVLDLSYNALEGNLSAVENLTLLTDLALNENFIGGNISSVHNLLGLKFLGVGAAPPGKTVPESAQRERDLIEVYDLEDTFDNDTFVYDLEDTFDDWQPFVLVGSLSEVSHLTNLTSLDVSRNILLSLIHI